MKEHGKLFNTAMVRAFLEGRKNQTRRVVDAHNSLVDGSGMSKKRWEAAAFDLANATIDNGPSPAGNPGPYLKAVCAEGTTHRIYSRVQPGDRIYVKETFRSRCIDGHPGDVIYKADHPGAATVPGSYGSSWKSSIHMPRRAARLVFDVVSVRLERLKGMSDEDVAAEGFEGDENGDAFLHFWNLWDAVNGKGSWDANPPVWIYDLQPVGINNKTVPRHG